MMDSPIQYALPAESITITPVDPDGRYLVTVEIMDDTNTPEFEAKVLAAFQKLGVTAAHVQFLYVQGAGVVFTQPVKEPEPVRGKHRG